MKFGRITIVIAVVGAISFIPLTASAEKTNASTSEGLSAAASRQIGTLTTPASSVSTGSGLIGPASAIGSAAIGQFKYTFGGVTIDVPSGCFLTHVMKGKGRNIKDQYAGVDCFGLAALHNSRFCNYRFDFVLRKDGKNYKRFTGKTHDTSCKTQLRTYTNPKVPYVAKHPGQGCAIFYVNGKKRAEQCHGITK